MTEPTTEAGRALNATLSYDADPPRYEPGDYIERYRAAILAIEAQAREGVTLTRDPGHRVAAVLSDEPVLSDSSGPSSRSVGAGRWYSEGWNRCARDVRAALASEDRT